MNEIFQIHQYFPFPFITIIFNSIYFTLFMNFAKIRKKIFLNNYEKVFLLLLIILLRNLIFYFCLISFNCFLMVNSLFLLFIKHFFSTKINFFFSNYFYQRKNQLNLVNYLAIKLSCYFFRNKNNFYYSIASTFLIKTQFLPLNKLINIT